MALRHSILTVTIALCNSARMMSNKTDFGPQAKRRLDEQGRKVKWLANEVDKSREHISLVLNGPRIPSVELIGKIADALGMDVPAKYKARAS